MSAILLEDLCFSYPPILPDGAPVEVLRSLSLAVSSGQALAFMGPTSSGKTTLALILAGLAPEMTGGTRRGQVWVNGLDATQTPAAEISAHLGLVFQEPERQLFNMTIADEVAFGLEGLAMPPAEIAARVTWALERVGLGDPDLLDRAPWQLSGGQQKRLAIATILALRPPILLLDEPMAGLDPLGRREVATVLRELKAETGATVIVLDKDAEFVARWAERVVVLAEGQVALDGTPDEVFRQVDRLHALGVAVPQIAELAAQLRPDGDDSAFLTAKEAAARLVPIVAERGRAETSQRMPEQRMGGLVEGHAASAEKPLAEDDRASDNRQQATTPLSLTAPDPAVDIRAVSFTYEGGTLALNDLSLAVPAGQFVALVGPNGGGKSTLARHLNGLLRPQHGSVAIHGQPTAKRAISDLAREVGYVFQNPDHQIFAPTVRDEISFGLRNLGLRGDGLSERVDGALAAFDLHDVGELPPAVLGYGLRRLVTVASVWAMRPPIWVLDEPTTGLDRHFTGILVDALSELHHAGHTILLITHDLRLVAEAAQRVVVIHEGRVALDGSPSSVLADAASLTPFGLRPPPITRLSAALAPYGFPHPILTVGDFVDCWHADTVPAGPPMDTQSTIHAIRPIRSR